MQEYEVHTRTDLSDPSTINCRACTQPMHLQWQIMWKLHPKLYQFQMLIAGNVEQSARTWWVWDFMIFYLRPTELTFHRQIGGSTLTIWWRSDTCNKEDRYESRYEGNILICAPSLFSFCFSGYQNRLCPDILRMQILIPEIYGGCMKFFMRACNCFTAIWVRVMRAGRMMFSPI